MMIVRRGLLAVSLCAALFAQPFAAAAMSPQEGAIRAAIIMQLPRYVAWKEIKKPTLCLMKNDSLNRSIKALNAKRETYKEILTLSMDQALSQCDVIYIDDKREARRLITSTADAYALIISNYSSFVDEGGTIGLINSSGSVGVEINLSNAMERGITLSPDLIEISRRVIQ